jgi:hypothetical protein
VKSRAQSLRHLQALHKRTPKRASKARVTVSDNLSRKTVRAKHMLNKQVSELFSCGVSATRRSTDRGGPS